MARFDAPYPGNEGPKNAEWFEAAHRGMRSPDQLWGEYWQRFNTFQIPLFDKEEYFSIAMSIVKDSKSKEDFERSFEEFRKRRLKEMRSMLKNMYWNLEQTRPTGAPHVATSDAQNLSCLEHLVRLLNDYIFDRKTDMESIRIVVEKQSYTEKSPLQERELVSDEDEKETLIREVNQDSSAEPKYEQYLRTGEVPDEWCTQLGPDIDWSYELNKEHKAARERYRDSEFYTRANIESLTSASDDATLHALNSDDDTPSIRQVPSLVSNDSQDLEEENETAALDGQRRRSSISSKTSSVNSAKKRVRFDDDEELRTLEPKRRKLDNASAHVETSPTSQTAGASSMQAVKGSASRKRSRSDEDEEDNGFKRQKIENLPHSPSPVPTASSTKSDSRNHLVQGTSEKVPEEQIPESNNGGQKRRKQKPTSPTSRAKSSRNTVNTRSSRRAKSPSLWELDSSGKPRST